MVDFSYGTRQIAETFRYRYCDEIVVMIVMVYLYHFVTSVQQAERVQSILCLLRMFRVDIDYNYLRCRSRYSRLSGTDLFVH